MTPQTPLFRKVFVHSEKDLPKIEGYYDAYPKDGHHDGTRLVRYRFAPGSIGDIENWMKLVRWYYQPVEQPEKEESSKEITKDIFQGQDLFRDDTFGLSIPVHQAIESFRDYLQSQSPDPEKIDESFRVDNFNQKRMLQEADESVENVRKQFQPKVQPEGRAGKTAEEILHEKHKGVDGWKSWLIIEAMEEYRHEPMITDELLNLYRKTLNIYRTRGSYMTNDKKEVESLCRQIYDVERKIKKMGN